MIRLTFFNLKIVDSVFLFYFTRVLDMQKIITIYNYS